MYYMGIYLANRAMKDDDCTAWKATTNVEFKHYCIFWNGALGHISARSATVVLVGKPQVACCAQLGT